jgi:citrate lyase subunit beta/citryl-CoA lyase
MRCWVLAPGDSDEKMGKAIACPADIALLDLEDLTLKQACSAADDLRAGHRQCQPRGYGCVSTLVPAPTVARVSMRSSSPHQMQHCLPRPTGQPTTPRLHQYFTAL